ncbi:MAG: hypothetical protein J5711_05445 [Bacteroidales bacterium]|nr:hypothetical protein [Bacteroidales bacterium]
MNFRKLLCITVAMTVALCSWSQTSEFSNWFKNRTLRIDYHRVGNAEMQSVRLVRYIAKNGQWAGSLTQLIDPINNGDYRVVVKDAESQKAIYSRTYGSLFSEYCGTDEGKTKMVTYEEVVHIPMPLKPVDIVMETRGKDQEFHAIGQFHFDPKKNKPERRTSNHAKRLQYKGSPNWKVDVVIVAQGYSKDPTKLKSDFERMKNVILSEEPFASRKDDFNIWGVAGDAGAHYGTLGADRYLMTDNLFQLHDLLDGVPFDHILILVNNDKYGGGGIYNFYAVASTNKMADMVTPHELGHSIGGLADEYVDENLSYTEIYKGEFEPVEPNITSLKDFNSKWRDMLPDDTPIPTPPVKNLDKRDCGPLGVYEGAGYQSKGLYRPVTNCMMNHYAHFCPVCQKRLNEMFDLYVR